MAKEILKDNVVEASTLFVGVGGTGSDIVKRVAEMSRPGELENVNFVCLDTNVNDLSGVAASKAHIYSVQTSNTQTVGSYLDYDQDALKNWFPKNAVIYDKTVSEGAGQVRAISRLALNSCIKTGKIRPLYDAIDDLFRKTGQAMKQAMRCVIVSTASGGTGSGIMLPMSMVIRDYVRNKYPNTSLIVRALVVLPETLDSVIDSNVERESQRRNAYATIKEINAFMMKGSGFLDIDEELKRYRNLHIDVAVPGSEERRSLSLLPFDFCFLMDGQNAEDSTLMNMEQYKQLAAQSLYEQNIGPMQKKAFGVEDNIIKEMSNPGNYGRNRFGGIGSSVIRYPYEEIADYIACGWAIDSIGGEGEAAKWTRYDNKYDVKRREAEQKGLSETEIPKRAEVYVDEIDNGSDNFSKDLRNKYLRDGKKRVSRYLSSLADYMHKSVNGSSVIQGVRNTVNELFQTIDYNDTNNRGQGRAHLDSLRAYEHVVRQNAQKIAESVAEGILINEKKTILANEPYTIEFALKNALGDVCHPNAARYMLYLIKTEMDKRVKTTTAHINNVVSKSLENYAPDANNVAAFDAKSTGKTHEKSLDELVALEKGENPSMLEKLGGYEAIYPMLNEHFPAYAKAIENLANDYAELAAYKIGAEYLKDLCDAYERFYRTFKDKVAALVRTKDEIVDSLKFHKGDSLLNICSDRAVLDELSRTTQRLGEDGAMLDSELNGAIFDAIKQNVGFEREIRYADVVEDDRRMDIFDEILLGYFKSSVRRTCSDYIDLNVIEAMAKENRLKERIRIREEQDSSSGEHVFDNVTQEQNERYIRDMVEVGRRLAAPGIQRITNEEAREVRLCAYNNSLLGMRAFRVKDLVDKGDAYPSISRYELHFFNALYNLTPNKLKKFAPPISTETGVKDAGLYHNAYFNYARHIGPDSTKDMMISTHIDKRWDSIAVMPEIDFGFQKARMMKIHQAVIYSLVHGAVTYRSMSQVAPKKKVYRYENSDERFVDLVVSNGTLCDEFYEILNAFYISSAIVEDVDVIKRNKRKRDQDRNSNYKDTAFAKDLRNFCIERIHTGPTSLFEIPLAYYNSLPNSQRYSGEISAVVDAVIKTLEDEVNFWERGSDARFLLCQELEAQFRLLMENYKKYESLRNGLDALDNPVLDMVFRKIKNIMTEAPEPEDYEASLQDMKALMR